MATAPGAPGATTATPTPRLNGGETVAQPAPPESSHNHFSPGDKPPTLPWPDIGHLAKWSVSSYKFGFGPECLRDGDPDTFWHSDGAQPHSVFIQFPRKTAVQKISLHLSFPLDDSYTPSTICLRAGTSLGDLQDVRVVSLDKPNGWITFDVSAELNEEGQEFKPVYCYVLQIIILANHMNGKDTHVRGLRILGPLEESTHEDDPFPFVSPRFKMFECIR
ncbi:anaphase-promoting complex, subunit 10 [Fomitiporia mediterranea MF3/22]|uniref:anaphase-promoting complex, subunit 10 n=1 Tax=Fomitiporia mediterranea (strain MF3/22) TaxID=694068 RepID=UPI000440947A|nr:anaphase-promoting complex, subunit 10 [Fomitiporia mediterranea MF3/22]EJD06675.1 anaphase-promoting complex, subunit 10 [Fomitiporia mediterranea MF3/22]